MIIVLQNATFVNKLLNYALIVRLFYNICSIKRYVFSLLNIALFSYVSFYKNKFNKIIVNRLDDAQINDIILSIKNQNRR